MIAHRIVVTVVSKPPVHKSPEFRANDILLEKNDYAMK